MVVGNPVLGMGVAIGAGIGVALAARGDDDG